MFRPFDVELCIVAFGSEAFASSWVSTAQWLDARVALADNGQHPTSIDALNETPGHERITVRTLHLPTNPGFGAACNRLAESSTARWLLFLNPDAKVTAIPHQIESLFTPNTITGATIVTPHDGWTHCAGQQYRVRDEIARSWFRRKPAAPTSASGGYVSGCAFLVERAVFLALGGFDEDFFLFYEDIDFCLRASATIAVQQACDWIVMHEGGHATRRDWARALTTSYESGRLFHQKHRHSRRGYDAYVFVDSMMRSGLQIVRKNKALRSAYRTLVRTALRNLRPLAKR